MVNHDEQLVLAGKLEQASPEDRRVAEAAMIGFLAGMEAKTAPSNK